MYACTWQKEARVFGNLFFSWDLIFCVYSVVLLCVDMLDLHVLIVLLFINDSTPAMNVVLITRSHRLRGDDG